MYSVAQSLYGYGATSPSHQPALPPPTWGTVPSPTSSSHSTFSNSIPALSPAPSINISPLDFGLNLDPITLTVSSSTSTGSASILNANLLRADGQSRFSISTDAGGLQTVIEDGSAVRVAFINWNGASSRSRSQAAAPTLYVDEVGWTMRTAEWLYLSSNRTCRTMIAHGRQFSWRPNGSCIELFPLNANSDSTLPNVNVLARITLASSGPIIQLAPRALHLKLLNYVVVSAVLLMSGRNID
ncbi:hypothetical protein C8F01DRAFT_1373537 [Mycena amicta]|nr:hypothetical protein C8F01DRAFT_1373537 [Mycena amicta]